ncbi:MAG: urea ABC transporter ATP-binding protein UrtD [Pseudomonadota bacterium]
MTSVDYILYLENVNKSFDGFKAINDLSLAIRPNELRAIIGPNGAGKSTMMDIITGKTQPDSGRILYKGSMDLTKYDECDIANMGIGRKFQKPTIIETLTVLENIELAMKGNRSVYRSLFSKQTNHQSQQALSILDQVKLNHKVNDIAGDLSHGQKQWLEIGMLLVQDPEILLIDEPAAGMTDTETMETAELLKTISQHHSVIVVEHDMAFVDALDTPVSVLHQGKIIAEGTLDTVSNNERVIEVYLGR